LCIFDGMFLCRNAVQVKPGRADKPDACLASQNLNELTCK
jgi:hypothetical protein